MARSPFNDTTQPVDNEDNEVQQWTYNGWFKKKEKTLALKLYEDLITLGTQHD